MKKSRRFFVSALTLVLALSAMGTALASSDMWPSPNGKVRGSSSFNRATQSVTVTTSIANATNTFLQNMYQSMYDGREGELMADNGPFDQASLTTSYPIYMTITDIPTGGIAYHYAYVYDVEGLTISGGTTTVTFDYTAGSAAEGEEA